MTQELIANMLGVRREGVTEAAGKLQGVGLIQYRRGKITVLDRPGWARACECYQSSIVSSRTLPGAKSHKASRVTVIRCANHQHPVVAWGAVLARGPPRTTQARLKLSG
jgi:hypothetical protein